MKSYLLYDENSYNIIQMVQCTDNEITMYCNKYIVCPDDFQFDSSKIQRVINGEVRSEYIQDEVTTLNTINSTYNQEIIRLVANIPEKEVATFPTQEREARAWIKDNTEYTPLIDGILINRTDVTKLDLVNKIIAKANTLNTAIGTITGERQALEKLILE